MTRPLPLSSYTDCEAAFTSALESPNGLRLTFSRPGLAVRFRQRLHKYRVLMREQSAEVYSKGSPQHGTSPYDSIIVQHTPGEAWLKLAVEDFSYQAEEL